MDFYKLKHIHGLENTREKIVVTIQHFMLDALLPLNTYGWTRSGVGENSTSIGI